jgi:hypothetical protein
VAQPVRGLTAEDAKRLKDLERENATLKQLFADAELEKAGFDEIAKRNFQARNVDGWLFVNLQRVLGLSASARGKRSTC